MCAVCVPFVRTHAYVCGIVGERSDVTKVVLNIQHVNARYRELHALFSRIVTATVIH